MFEVAVGDSAGMPLRHWERRHIDCVPQLKSCALSGNATEFGLIGHRRNGQSKLSFYEMMADRLFGDTH